MDTKTIGITLIIFLCLSRFGRGEDASPNDQETSIVTTTTGELKGKLAKISDKTVSEFFGIPFAEPPTGESRFKKPTPAKKWDGVLNATVKSPPCMQYSERDYPWIAKENPSEDCLYLNVWVPNRCCGQNESKKLPVMVFIHGGGYQYGSSGMDIYDGAVLATTGNVIVASMNYRVGALGFLQMGTEDAPGNMGLYDQNLAMKWIKDNIQAFGGDSDSITLFGHSAGSVSVGLHIISKMSRSLFKRAIMISGSPYHPIFGMPIEMCRQKGKEFATLLGCANETTNASIEVDFIMECLRNANATELAKADSQIAAKDPFSFLPNYGNEFLPKTPIETIQDGDYEPIELLAGVARDEGSIFINYFMPEFFTKEYALQLSVLKAKVLILGMFKVSLNPTAKAVADFYLKNVDPNDSGVLLKAVYDSFGDFIFVCPSNFFAEEMKGNTSYYVFTHRASNSEWGEWTSANHMEIISFIFGYPLQDSDSYKPEEKEFSQSLIHKFESFARNGTLPLKSQGEWPKYTKDNPQYLDLNPKNERIGSGFHQEICEFWRSSIVKQR